MYKYIYSHRSLSSAVILVPFIKSWFLVSPQQYAQLQEFYHSYTRSCMRVFWKTNASVVSSRSRHVVLWFSV